ncbi:hypothetical protein [uncultured Campylobacter sp.]|uniref:hypothetical protein n=1 Tax=uncultured Campylobacter sp. TaxID=218934 RepID=UPI0026047230|nr:hypothetical protein [uncultured Campylobacter sp.]
MYKITIKRSADKELNKILKGNLKAGLKICTFLKELEKSENPFATSNARNGGLRKSLALESWYPLPSSWHKTR